MHLKFNYLNLNTIATLKRKVYSFLLLRAMSIAQK